MSSQYGRLLPTATHLWQLQSSIAICNGERQSPAGCWVKSGNRLSPTIGIHTLKRNTVGEQFEEPGSPSREEHRLCTVVLGCAYGLIDSSKTASISKALKGLY